MTKIGAKNISWFFLFFWLACLTSQSLMDLADGLLFLFGLSLLFQAARASNQWRKIWPNSTGLEKLWLVWVLIIANGLFLSGVESKVFLKNIFEFRWMLIFQVLCFTLTLLPWTEDLIKKIMAALGLLIAISYILFFQSEQPRAGGVFGHSMPFAHTYGMAFAFISGITLVGFQNLSKWRWYGLALSLAAGLIVSLSLTRGIWLGMAFALMVITVLSPKKYGLIILASMLGFFAVTMIVSPEARERVISTNSGLNQSDGERKAFWRANWEMVKDNPFFGTGYSQNNLQLQSYFEKLGIQQEHSRDHAHNQYLHMWAGTGSLGLICYLFFIYYLISRSLKVYQRIDKSKVNERALSLGVIGAQFCFIVGSVTESNFSIAKNRYLFLLLSAITVSLYMKYIKVSSAAKTES